MSKCIFFDSSTLISMAMTCSCQLLEKLHKDYGGDFYITKSVEQEAIRRAIKDKKFKYEAFRLKHLLNREVLKVYNEKQVGDSISHLNNVINSAVFVKNKAVRIVHDGELSLLAAAKKEGADALAIDERTTRLVVEAPERVAQVMEHKLHTKVKVDMKKLSQIKKEMNGLQVIRSVDLAVAAHRKGYLIGDGHEALEALLWALKFAGTAISGKEISWYLRNV